MCFTRLFISHAKRAGIFVGRCSAMQVCLNNVWNAHDHIYSHIRFLSLHFNARARTRVHINNLISQLFHCCFCLQNNVKECSRHATHSHTHVCEACISNMSHVFVVDTSFFLPLLLCFEIYVYFTQSATHADQPFE